MTVLCKGGKYMRRGREQGNIKISEIQCDEPIGWRDIIAIIIAQFQILMPIVLGAIFIMSLLLFIIMKIWIRS